MSETIAELVAKISADTSALKKGLADSEKGIAKFGNKTEKETKSISASFQTMGKAFAVVGASLTAAMGLAIKSFTATGSELHDMALKTGVSVEALAGLKYAAEQNGASLASVQMALRTMANTLNDATDGLETAKRSLTKLGLSLDDLKGLNPEQQFMKIASAIAQIPDPMTRSALAVDMFGRSGTDMLPMLSGGAAGLRKLMEEGQKYSGITTENAKLADEFGDNLQALKTSVSGLFLALASNLVPTLQRLVSGITDTIGKMKDWAKEHPEVARSLEMVGFGLAAVLTTVGALALAIPKLTAAWKAFSLVFTASPIGLVLTALTAIGVVAISVIDRMDQVAEKNKAAASSYYEYWEAEVAAGRAINETNLGYSHYIRLSAEVVAANKKAAESVKAATPSVESVKTAIDALRRSYGDLGNAVKTKGDQARYASEQAIRGLDDELKKARESYQEQMSALSELYSEKIRVANATADQEISGIQDKIDALDKSTEAEDRALADERYKKRKYELEKEIWLAKAHGTQEEYTRLKKELAELSAENERRLLLQARSDEKDKLRQSIENVKKKARAAEDSLQKELRDLQETEKNKLLATENRIERTKQAVERALQHNLKLLADELKAKEDTELSKLAATDTRLKEEERLARQSYEQQKVDAEQFVEELNAIFARVIGANGGGGGGGGGGGVPPAADPGEPIWYTPIPYVAEGGVVTRPTVAMVGEAGPEAIIPLNEMGNTGGVTINFTQPVFFDREDTMNKFVALIRKGIQRQDRQRFGAAYNG